MKNKTKKPSLRKFRPVRTTTDLSPRMKDVADKVKILLELRGKNESLALGLANFGAILGEAINIKRSPLTKEQKKAARWLKKFAVLYRLKQVGMLEAGLYNKPKWVLVPAPPNNEDRTFDQVRSTKKNRCR